MKCPDERPHAPHHSRDRTAYCEGVQRDPAVTQAMATLARGGFTFEIIEEN